MALSTKHRSHIYERLAPMLGEEEADALLSQFPARDVDEPVTQAFVHAEIADLRGDLRSEIAELRTELRTEIAGVRTDMASLEGRITERLRQQTIWMSGAMAVGMGLAAGIGTLAG